MNHKEYKDYLLEKGQYRLKADACIIPGCLNSAKVAILDVESDIVSFYCQECADVLLMHLPNEFKLVSK